MALSPSISKQLTNGAETSGEEGCIPCGSLPTRQEILSVPGLTRLKAESNRGREITASLSQGTESPSCLSDCFSSTLQISKAPNRATKQQPDLGQTKQQCRGQCAFEMGLGCSLGVGRSRIQQPGCSEGGDQHHRHHPRQEANAAGCTVMMPVLLLLHRGYFGRQELLCSCLGVSNGETISPGAGNSGPCSSRDGLIPKQSFTWVLDRGRCSSSEQGRVLRAGTKHTGHLCNSPRKINAAQSCCPTERDAGASPLSLVCYRTLS